MLNFIIRFLGGVTKEDHADVVGCRDQYINDCAMLDRANISLEKEVLRLDVRCVAFAEQNLHLLAGGEIINVRKAKSPFGPLDQVEEFYPDDMNVAAHETEAIPGGLVSACIEAAELMGDAEVPTEDRMVMPVVSVSREEAEKLWPAHDHGAEKI